MKQLACAILVLLAACSGDLPEDKLLSILNERTTLVAHIGKITKAEILSTAKSKSSTDGKTEFSCEVRLLYVTGKKGKTYVSFMRRETPTATDSALSFADDREAANGQLGRMLSEHCKS